MSHSTPRPVTPGRRVTPTGARFVLEGVRVVALLTVIVAVHISVAVVMAVVVSRLW